MIGTRTILQEGSYSLDPQIKNNYFENSSVELDEDVFIEKLSYPLKGRTFDFDVPDYEDALEASDNHGGLTGLVSVRRNIELEEGDATNLFYGIAVDIGTSKIACHLVEMSTGVSLCIESEENPQVAHGEDVMSRITYAMRGENNTSRLSAMLHGSINRLVAQACQMANIEPEEIYEGVIVGNTLMHHLFLGLNPSPLANAPFKPVMEEPVSVTASEYDIDISNAGVLYLPPPLAGFVGSDAISDLLASGAYESREKCILIDIGTNTEVFVGDYSGFDACSCASGPAFEGAHITNGVKAVPGAIEHLSIDPKNFQIIYETIGVLEPIGLCGSAIIDVIAEMWESKLLDDVGRFQSQNGPPNLWTDKGFLLVPFEDTATSSDITIHQSDVEEVLKAKAAIHAAISIMLNRHEIAEEEISRVFIAGDFGSNIDPCNAIGIGMLPRVEPDIVEFRGNTALQGAKMQLLSREARRTAIDLKEKIKYHELSLDPQFDREYINSLFIPYRDLGS